MDVNWYSDWDFWTFAAAAVAIVLSQLAPVRFWFLGRKLEVELPSRINVSHKFGNPNLGILISLRNTGGKDIRIKTMHASVIRDNKIIATLPAQNFFEGYGKESPIILLMPFTLRPGESWLHVTNFLEFFDRPTERTARESTAALTANLRRKFKDNKAQGTEDVIVVADDELVSPLLNLFKQKFIWFPGEYIFELTVSTDKNGTSFKQKYRFTIYESESKELESQADDYKTGAGVVYESDNDRPISTPIHPL